MTTTDLSMNTQIYEEATQWLVQHRDGGLNGAGKLAFDRWLRTSPEHVRAYLEMSSVWQDVSEMETDEHSAARIIERAAADPTNVVSLDGANSRSGEIAAIARLAVRAEGRLPRRRFVAAAAVAVLCVVGALAVWLNTSGSRTYATEIGEQRSVVLSDGSTVELNSRSRVRVRFDDAQRRVQLLEGQALFRVARDGARPFVVLSRDTRVQAVGTEFDVYRRQASTVVTVIEGRVVVRPGERAAAHSTPQSGSGDAGSIYLSAGEQMMVAAKAITQPRRVDVAVATAWMQRHLVFDSAPLSEVAEEFNRYNARQLVIDAPELSGFRVSGVFSSAEPTLLIKFLRNQPEIVVIEAERAIHIDTR